MESTLIIMAICLMASILGAICGVGGGIIIKPLLDSLGSLSIETTVFLSGFTVISMSGYSVIMAVWCREWEVKLRTGIPLAIGAAHGGIVGKYLFGLLKDQFPNANQVGIVQSTCLIVLTIIILLYTFLKHRMKGLVISNSLVGLSLGILLGNISAFLGIGGGPINIVLLSLLFSMNMKEAVQNSLFIIFISQCASILFAITVGNLPDLKPHTLLGSSLAGIMGAILGRRINKGIKDKTVTKLFIGLNFFIIMICVYNIYRFYSRG